VSVRIDDNLVDSLDVGVSNDKLRVGLKSGTSVTNATLEAEVTVRSLESLDGSGASTIVLSDELTADTMTVTVSGASRVSGSLAIGSGSINLSGASGAELSGSATTLEITASGASDLDALELTTGELSVDLSGASEADVTVTESLSAVASGASTLRYAGSPPRTQVDTSGASTIETMTEISN
jgi:hypothetical protein